MKTFLKTIAQSIFLTGAVFFFASVTASVDMEKITVTTIAESGEGCQDGAFIINSCPERQSLGIKVNPGGFCFDIITPDTLRPANSTGFSARVYNLQIFDKRKNKISKNVEIPLAQYSVEVRSTPARGGCNGSFVTLFKNPDNADVTVTYSAFDSQGVSIGTTGVYTDLCPGVYNWTVQANSKSATCNNGVVFHDSNTITIGGTGPLGKPTLTPSTQSVPLGGTIRFAVIPVDAQATYILHTPGRGNITQQGSGTFSLTNAKCTDAGGYFVEVILDGNTKQSDPVTVQVGGSCNLSLSLTPSVACGSPLPGNILLTFTGGSGFVNYSLNGIPQPGVITSPFTIMGLAAGTYAVSVVDTNDASCTAQATTTVSTIVLPPPTLSAPATCSGLPLVITVLPAGQASYTLFLPDGTQLTQTNNIFTIPQATPAMNGNFSANFIDINGCASAKSAAVPITILPTVVAVLTPTVQSVPQFATIRLVLAPSDPNAVYQIQSPNPQRGSNGVITQVGNPVFDLTSAGPDDIGTYFGLINAAGCTSALSNTVTVTLGGTCNLALGLTTIPACNANGFGSVALSFAGGSGTVNYSLNGVAQPGPIQTPFTIPNLAPNIFYSVAVNDVTLTNCTNTASVLLTAEKTVATPTLIANTASVGGTLTFTVSPANQSNYILTLPNNTTILQTKNVFTFPQATTNQSGAYFATYIDQSGCRSGSSNIVRVNVSAPTIATLTPTTQTVPKNGTIRLVATPANADLYVLFKPDGETITQTSNEFIIAPASLNEEGAYKVQVTANGSPPSNSAPVLVKVSGSCGLAIGLTAHDACRPTDKGSIDVTFTGAQKVSYALNGVLQPALVTSPFTISNLVPQQNYTVQIKMVTPCNTCATQATIRVGVEISEPPTLTAQNVCQNGSLTLTVLPAGQKSYTLTLPNQTTITQDANNIFTILNATAANNNGNYTATFVSNSGCQSPSSNVVTVAVQPIPAAVLTPSSQAMFTGGTVTFTALPAGADSYSLTAPDGTVINQTNNVFVIPNVGSNDSGAYSVAVTISGCTSPRSANANISVGGCLPFTLSPVPAVANTSLGSIVVTVSGGIAPFSYTVNGGASVSADTSPFTIPNLPGSRTYSVAVQDSQLCSNLAPRVTVPTVAS